MKPTFNKIEVKNILNYIIYNYVYSVEKNSKYILDYVV